MHILKKGTQTHIINNNNGFKYPGHCSKLFWWIACHLNDKDCIPDNNTNLNDSPSANDKI